MKAESGEEEFESRREKSWPWKKRSRPTRERGRQQGRGGGQQGRGGGQQGRGGGQQGRGGGQQGRGGGQQGGGEGPGGRARQPRTIITDEMRATVIDHVIVHGMTMAEAGLRVRPNLSRFTVATIIRAFRPQQVLYSIAFFVTIQFYKPVKVVYWFQISCYVL